MGMTVAGETARESLKAALEKMKKGGKYGPFHNMMICLNQDEVRFLLGISEENADWETGYYAGFEYGRQMMLKDVIKTLGRMKWHGGGYKKVRTGEVPEGAGRAEKSVQPEI